MANDDHPYQPFLERPYPQSRPVKNKQKQTKTKMKMKKNFLAPRGEIDLAFRMTFLRNRGSEKVPILHRKRFMEQRELQGGKPEKRKGEGGKKGRLRRCCFYSSR
jgi:hypothetical protein